MATIWLYIVIVYNSFYVIYTSLRKWDRLDFLRFFLLISVIKEIKRVTSDHTSCAVASVFPLINKRTSLKSIWYIWSETRAVKCLNFFTLKIKSWLRVWFKVEIKALLKYDLTPCLTAFLLMWIFWQTQRIEFQNPFVAILIEWKNLLT